MGVDGMESEVAHVSGENVKSEPIMAGTHGTEDPNLLEAIKEDNVPKNPTDEWPEAKKFHTFYFVKWRSIEDQNLKAKIDQAEKEISNINNLRNPIVDKLREKKAERQAVIEKLKVLTKENSGIRKSIDDKRKELLPLTSALSEIQGPRNQGSRNANRDGRSYICSSEQELDDIIKSLQYRIQHEVIPLDEEKKLIREIKQLEGTREKVVANSARIQEVVKEKGNKESLQDQVKLIGVDMDGVRKDQQAVRAKVKILESEKEALNNVISSIEGELDGLSTRKDKAFEKRKELWKQREDGNSCFRQNRVILNKGRDLAGQKEVNALKELSTSEVDKFMSQWNSSKAFREDYERRILQSLDFRQLTRDGRMRNPGEKPLVSLEAQHPVAVETDALAKPKPKQQKEDATPPLEDTAPIEKDKTNKNQKDANGKTKGIKDVEEEEVFGLAEKPKKLEEIDMAKLKEMKREEEIAKAKQALERKKKQAEKAAAKAKIKAEKEAEKKIKEREKKAKKKMQGSAPVAEAEETTATTEEGAAVEVPEPEKAEENVQAPPKMKERKESTTIRSRGRGKGPESISKVILKRKKSSSYMYYYAAAGAALVVMLLAIGYTFYA